MIKLPGNISRIICYLLLSLPISAFGQQTIPLYADSIPNSKAGPDEEFIDTTRDVLIIHKISRPTLTIYLPPKSKNTGAAVIICPGGGYSVEAAGHEGADVAKKFNEMGIAAFVLKYRIPSDLTMVDRSIGPLQDAQRAIQLVRINAKKWKVNKSRIGIMGFSAGGHLASTAGTHFGDAYIEPIKKISLRPDFLVLIYPVISFRDTIGHVGSKNQLIGANASKEKTEAFSNELHVTSATPPTFLVHAKDDFVKILNSQLFADALDKNAVPNKLFIYESGGHGYGMYNKASTIQWMDVLQAWLIEQKIIR